MPRPKTLVHLMFTDFVWESRVLRQSRAALKGGFAKNIVLIGYRDGDQPTEETLENGIVVHRLVLPGLSFLPRLPRRALQWLIWSFKSSALARKQQASVLQAHSLAAMFAGALAKRGTRTPLIYDCHELETERAGWSAPVRAVSKWMERVSMSFADRTLVVGKRIQEWYEETYRKPIDLVRNVPNLPVHKDEAPYQGGIRNTLKIPSDHLLFVYLGAIGHGRGVESILSVFETLVPNRHVTFLGRGELVPLVQSYAERCPNITCLPPVPSQQVVPYVASADVGLSLIEDVALSYRYSLPNKLFECRHAGLPVLVSDLPEMASFIDAFGGGWKVGPSIDDIRRAVLMVDRKTIGECLSNARTPPSWDQESAKYLAVLADVSKE
jgi:glycosyltransferase involved in cell wall biosynthesis